MNDAEHGQPELGPIMDGLDQPSLAFVERLRELYQRSGWVSLSEFAGGVCYSPSTLSRFMSGKRRPPAVFLDKLFVALEHKADGRPLSEELRSSTRRLYFEIIRETRPVEYQAFELEEQLREAVGDREAAKEIVEGLRQELRDARTSRAELESERRALEEAANQESARRAVLEHLLEDQAEEYRTARASLSEQISDLVEELRQAEQELAATETKCWRLADELRDAHRRIEDERQRRLDEQEENQRRREEASRAHDRLRAELKEEQRRRSQHQAELQEERRRAAERERELAEALELLKRLTLSNPAGPPPAGAQVPDLDVATPATSWEAEPSQGVAEEPTGRVSELAELTAEQKAALSRLAQEAMDLANHSSSLHYSSGKQAAQPVAEPPAQPLTAPSEIPVEAAARRLRSHDQDEQLTAVQDLAQLMHELPWAMTDITGVLAGHLRRTRPAQSPAVHPDPVADAIVAAIVGRPRRDNEQALLLQRINLDHADFRGARLKGAVLTESSLVGANLSGADLSDASLAGADLLLADLSGANLRGTNLTRAHVAHADLGDVQLWHTDLSGVDLTSAMRLPPLQPEHALTDARTVLPRPKDLRHATVPVSRPDGPWDLSEVIDPAQGRVDLGGLFVPRVEDMELRVEVARADIVAATVVLHDSAIQLQAFAAPKSESIWGEVRDEIASGIRQRGGIVDEVEGPLGWELRTQIPVQLPDGTRGVQLVRFVGCDGPRWFLRGVISGQGTVHPQAAGVLEAVFRDTVISRGQAPMAPRDPILLRLPNDLQMVPEGAVSDQTSEVTGPLSDGTRSARRGPEDTAPAVGQ